jgi:ubiquinone/menaquinone biosynthesis C-methylase UbiE/uncharacterized protein YbaR (Trm112 family)
VYKDIIGILRCPECKSGLNLIESEYQGEEIISGRMACECGHQWFIRDGILDFGSHEQEFANSWSEVNLEEAEKIAKEKTPPGLAELFSRTIEEISACIAANKPGIVVDIATGRGMLLAELAENISSETQLVATDLSYSVLRYDRVKMKHKGCSLKINYIACDASNLPFQDDAFDASVSFFGIQNMMNLVPQGISESRRVLKKDCSLINAAFAINGDSKANEILKQFCIENNLTPYVDFVTCEGIKKAYGTAGFSSMTFKMVGEGIGEKNELDLIPYEGEWYEINIVYSEK